MYMCVLYYCVCIVYVCVGCWCVSMCKCVFLCAHTCRSQRRMSNVLLCHFSHCSFSEPRAKARSQQTQESSCLRPIALRLQVCVWPCPAPPTPKLILVFPPHVCLCTMRVPGSHRGQKRATGCLELELYLVVSHHVGAAN